MFTLETLPPSWSRVTLHDLAIVAIVEARGGGWTPIWNIQGYSSEILNLIPKGDHLGAAKAFL